MGKVSWLGYPFYFVTLIDTPSQQFCFFFSFASFFPQLLIASKFRYKYNHRYNVNNLISMRNIIITVNECYNNY